MGGEAAGEVASRVTVRAVAEWMTDKLISASLKSTHEEKIAAPTQTGGLRLAIANGHEMATTEMLRQAVISANREVMAYAARTRDERGLGATRDGRNGGRRSADHRSRGRQPLLLVVGRSVRASDRRSFACAEDGEHRKSLALRSAQSIHIAM